jgi:hypothetical protein
MSKQTNPKTKAAMPRHVRELFEAAQQVAFPCSHFTPEVLACHLDELHAAVVAFMRVEPVASGQDEVAA